MIVTGSMVKFKPHTPGMHKRDPRDIYTVLEVEGPADFERMVHILHPNGGTSWEFFSNLEGAT